MTTFMDFGKVTGGADGQWVWVENLNPDGDLSLRHALTRTDILGPRNIGFKVTGDIFGSIDVSTVGDFTIHGDTSPGGICLRNAPDDMADTLNIQTNNVIINNIRIRPGHCPSSAPEARRALNFQRTKGAIVANCSLTWAYDQIFSAWYGCEDILFYRNLIAEGLYDYGTGKYGMGGLVGDAVGGTGGGDVYFYQNVFAHNKGRNPKINIAGIGYIWNNLMYNPGDWVCHITDRFGSPRADVIGNVLIPGAQGNSNADWVVRADGSAKLYVRDNIGPKRQWDDPDETGGVVYTSTTSVTFRSTPFLSAIPFEMVPAQKLEDYLLTVAGATPRDAADSRIIGEILDRTGVQIGDETDVGGYPVLVAPTTTTDPATTTDGSTTTDPATTTDGSTTTDPATTADGSTTTDPATTTDGSTTTDPATTTDGSTTTDPATTTDGSTTTDPATTTDGSTTTNGSTTTDPATTADGSTTTDPATTADGSTTTDPATTTNGSTTTVEPVPMTFTIPAFNSDNQPVMLKIQVMSGSSATYSVEIKTVA